MNLKQLTPNHLFCFVYIGFAHLSNENISQEVIDEIERKVAMWMNVSPSNITEFNKVLRETSYWYNSLEEKDHMNAVLNISKSISDLEGFDEESRKTFLSDIRDIAVADGRFSDREKEMHDIIGRELGVNIMTVDKKKKGRLGY